MRSAQIIIEEAITEFFWNVFRDSGRGMPETETGDTHRSENFEQRPSSMGGRSLPMKSRS